MRRQVLISAMAGAVCLVSGSGIALAAAWQNAQAGSGGGKADVLGQPTGGSASGATQTSLNLSWNAPTGLAPGGYKVFRNGSEITTGGAGSCNSPSGPSCQDSGLANNTTYIYTVKATKGSWLSAASDPFQGKTLAQATTVASIALANSGNSGSHAGKAEPGDTVTVTFSAAVTPSTICSGLNDTANTASTVNTASGLTATITDGGSGNDSLGLSAASGTCSGSVHFGSINLGSTAWVTGTVNFSGDGTQSGGSATSLAMNAAHTVLTLTLGGKTQNSGSVTSSNVTATYTPDANITDTNGNAISGTGSSTAEQF